MQESEERMRKLFLVLIVLSLAGGQFCDRSQKGGDTEVVKRPGARNAEPVAETASEDKKAPELVIESVTFNLDSLGVGNDVVATAELQAEPQEDVAFTYRWYVNGQEIADVDGNTLVKGNFKKKI